MSLSQKGKLLKEIVDGETLKRERRTERGEAGEWSSGGCTNDGKHLRGVR